MSNSHHSRSSGTAHLLQRLLPQQQSTFSVSLPLEVAQQRLAASFATEIVLDKISRFSVGTRYVGEIEGSGFSLRGPYGNRKWRLVTRGKLRSQGSQTLVQLNQRIATEILISSAVVFICYGVGATVMLSGVISGMAVVVVFQILFIYLIALAVFRHEANQVSKLLLIILERGTPPTQSAELR